MSQSINVGPDFEQDEDTDRELAEVVDELSPQLRSLGDAAMRTLRNQGFSPDEVQKVRAVEDDVVKAGRFAWDLFSELFDKEEGGQ